MPKLPQQIVNKRSKRLKEVSMLEQIYYLMPEDPPENYVAWEGQETYHSPKPIRMH